VRLRFINASSMTFFDVRIPGLKMTVVQADGNDVQPVAVDEFRIGVAETYDVVVSSQDAGAYSIFAQSEDRSGYARGTLATSTGMSAAIPPMDPRPQRTMADMGMGNMKGMKPGDMPGMDMSGMDEVTAKGMPTSSGDKANQPGMAGMDMGSKAASPDMESMPEMQMRAAARAQHPFHNRALPPCQTWLCPEQGTMRQSSKRPAPCICT